MTRRRFCSLASGAALDFGEATGPALSEDQLAGATGSLSRVHLVLLLDGGDVWAVDTASLNGTIVEGQRISAIQLDREIELRLPSGMGMRWVPEHIPPT